MHDWHLTNEILKTVLEYATKNGLKNVSRIEIELGSILEHGELIKSENLIHNFKLLAEKTIAKNAKLKIKKITRLDSARQAGDAWKLVSIKD
jgi:hydrogenase nickel incorporation protein HypA/HybF